MTPWVHFNHESRTYSVRVKNDFGSWKEIAHCLNLSGAVAVVRLYDIA